MPLNVTVWETQGSPAPRPSVKIRHVRLGGTWQCPERIHSPPQASANSPARQGVEVPFLRLKHLVFHPSQSKANGQHSEGEDEETGDPKHSSPSVKPARRGRKGMSALGDPQGTFIPSPKVTQSGTGGQTGPRKEGFRSSRLEEAADTQSRNYSPPPRPQPFRPHETPRFHPQGLWTGKHPAPYLQPLIILICKVEEPSHVKEGLSGVLQQ